MRKRKMLATGGIVTTMLFTSAGHTFAQKIPIQKTAGQTKSTQLGYDPGVVENSLTFGIKADDEISDLELEEASRQVLIDEGFTASQIHKIFTTAHSYQKGKGAKEL